jgi:plasmid stabilization system protein ParE
MNVRKSDVFISDIECQFEWYVQNAEWEVAEGYSRAVEATCTLLARHPQLGARLRFVHPRLREWRFFVVVRPFQKHVIFYEVTKTDVILRRVMHGHRDLPKRLLEN